LKGKDLLSRVIVGSLFGSLFIITALSHPIFLLIFLIIWLGIATKEFLNLLAKIGLKFPAFLLIGVNTLFLLLVYFAVPSFYSLFLLIAIFFWAIIRSPASEYLAFGLFSLFYLAFLPSHLLLLKHLVTVKQLSNFLLLFPIFFTWVNDTLAYGIGKRIGKRKLAERISPKKTWEGFWGGLIFSIPFSYFYLNPFLPNASPSLFVLLSILLSILAQIGDLVESIFKREAGVKDSSSLLLAHGGFLDRIDSLLFTIPGFYYFLKLYLGI
jgi:phosphatidate cytidylyltransferase